VNLSTAYDPAPGDYVELLAIQDSGASLTVRATGNLTPEFMRVRLVKPRLN
jgi:hypothetical protein